MGEWVGRNYRAILLLALTAAILIGLVLFEAFRPGRPAPIMTVFTPAPSPVSSATPLPIQVHVKGAVENPGLYSLPPGSRVNDAVLAAGGLSTGADVQRINLAEYLDDGQEVYVPRSGEENLPTPLPAQRIGPVKVNINTADAGELEVLPEIGPTLAKRIVDFRRAHGPFASAEEIMEVEGIGPSIFAKIEELITTK